MSLIFGDSFGWAGTGSRQATEKGPWTSVAGLYTSTDLGNGRRSVYATAGTSLSARIDPPTPGNTWVVHALFHHNEAIFTPRQAIEFRDDTSIMGNIFVDAGGYIKYRRSTTVVATATTTVTPNTTFHIGVKVYIHGSAGTVDFWINGVAAGSFTGLNTLYQGTTCDNIRFATFNWGDEMPMSDFVLDDADYLGEIKASYDPCSAAGQSAQWTPSTGSNHENVDDIPADDDSTYNSTSTVNDKDSLKHTGLSGTVSSIAGVMGIIKARKEGAGGSTIKVGVYHGASESQGSAEALSTDFEWFSHLTLVNPSTASAWQASELANAEVSYEKTA